MLPNKIINAGKLRCFLFALVACFLNTMSVEAFADSVLTLACQGIEQLRTELYEPKSTENEQQNVTYSIQIDSEKKSIAINPLGLFFCDDDADQCKCTFTKTQFFCFSHRLTSPPPMFIADRSNILIDRLTGATKIEIDSYSMISKRDKFKKISLICEKTQNKKF
jgi:hypothetical protein